MPTQRPAIRFGIVAVICICLIVGAQALAAASAPKAGTLSQTAVVGQAGFAYLGGLRLFGAGLLYARLDTQLHQYNSGKNIKDRLDLLPTIRLVQALNPQLEQPYYYVSFVLQQRGMHKEALALAQDGIKANPTSGLLRASYVQLLMMQDRKGNLPTMIQQAQAGLSPKAQYSSVDSQFWSYGVYKSVAHLAGDKEAEQAINAAQQQLGKMSSGANSNANGGGGVGGLLNAWENSAMTSEDE